VQMCAWASEWSVRTLNGSMGGLWLAGKENIEGGHHARGAPVQMHVRSFAIIELKSRACHNHPSEVKIFSWNHENTIVGTA
jgi:hypothetical protein